MAPMLPLNRRRCLRGVKLGIIYCIVAARVLGMVLYIVWVLDCQLREFKMAIICENFSLYPHPEIVTPIWLMIVSLTSIFLIAYIQRLPTSPGFKQIAQHLLRNKYFYKISVTLALVTIYDLITVADEVTFLYIAYPVEHITSIALVFTLNFAVLAKFIKNTDSRWNKVVYKAILAVYAIENYTMFMLNTMLAAYHLFTFQPCFSEGLANNSSLTTVISTHDSTKISTEPIRCHDAKSTIMLLLRLALISFRYMVGEFFLTKLFRENSDVLHEPLDPIASLSEGVEMLDIPEGISNDERRPDV
ncbi:hypothetical protein QZH41_007687 [Actinostola sp. cb2023]|nr:hypothetical protein QZH41_007687 [Actinostola sp. cb2023]